VEEAAGLKIVNLRYGELEYVRFTAGPAKPALLVDSMLGMSAPQAVA